MTLVLTQSDFRKHIEDYLDMVNEDDETVYIALPNSKSVAVVSQEKMNWLEIAVQAKEDSLASAVARDQLIRRRVLPDDDIVESDDNFWCQF